jgi:hypothetical protein
MADPPSRESFQMYRKSVVFICTDCTIVSDFTCDCELMHMVAAVVVVVAVVIVVVVVVVVVVSRYYVTAMTA